MWLNIDKKLVTLSEEKKYKYSGSPDVNNSKPGGQGKAVNGSVLKLVLEASELLDPVPGLPDGVLALPGLHEALVDDPVGLRDGGFLHEHHPVENPF